MSQSLSYQQSFLLPLLKGYKERESCLAGNKPNQIDIVTIGKINMCFDVFICVGRILCLFWCDTVKARMNSQIPLISSSLYFYSTCFVLQSKSVHKDKIFYQQVPLVQTACVIFWKHVRENWWYSCLYIIIRKSVVDWSSDYLNPVILDSCSL